MKDLAALFGIIVLALLAGLLKAFVIMKIFVLYDLAPGLSFVQVYGIILVINTILVKDYKKEKDKDTDMSELFGKALGVGFVGPLLVWFFAWVMTFIVR